jgi:hypothetical protein
MNTAAKSIEQQPAKKRGPYLKQFKRPEDPSLLPPFHFQPKRDLSILKAVFENRFMDFSLLNSLFPPDLARTPLHVFTKEPKAPGSNLRKRLKKLHLYQFLERLNTHRTEEHIYAIGQKGADELLARNAEENLNISIQHRYDWKEKSYDPHRLYVEHTLMVARFRVALEVATRNHPSVKLLHFERESKDLKYTWKTNGKKPCINPDAYFVLQDTKQPPGKQLYAYFLEADRHNVSKERMLERYTQYSLFLAEKEYKNAFPNMEFFRVLTIAPNEKHAKALLKLPTDNEQRFPTPSTLPKNYRIPAKHLDMFYFTHEQIYFDNEKNLLHKPTNVLARIYLRSDDYTQQVPLIPSPLART